MPPHDPIVLVLSNVPPAQAESIARKLVESRAAACVSLSPTRSVYSWKGELCKDEEVTAVCKTTSSAAAELMQLLRSLHPYEVPEIIVLPVADGLPEYLQWVATSVGTENSRA